MGKSKTACLTQRELPDGARQQAEGSEARPGAPRLKDGVEREAFTGRYTGCG